MMGNSDTAWRAGLDVLAATPLPASELGSERMALAKQLQRPAMETGARKGTLDLSARAVAYGDLLVTCAACHAKNPSDEARGARHAAGGCMMNPQIMKLAITRDTILKLLTDAEVANVSRDEGQARLGRGDEFVDLEQIGLGIQKLQFNPRVELPTAVAQGSVSDATWRKIVSALAGGAAR
jgi:hypothetical protein